MLITTVDILSVFLVVSSDIRFLYASARGCVVAGNGKANHASVGKCHLLLNQPLTKRATADDSGAVVILHSTCKYLGCRCRSLVNQYHKWNFLIAAVPVADVILPLRFASLRINYQFVFGQKLVGHLHSRLQISACVVAQVNNQILKVALRQFGQCYQ